MPVDHICKAEAHKQEHGISVIQKLEHCAIMEKVFGSEYLIKYSAHVEIHKIGVS